MWHGETKCSQCKRPAYYKAGNSPRCGYHSEKGIRKTLPKNPVRIAEKIRAKESHRESVQWGQMQNVNHNVPGVVICTKIDGIRGQPKQLNGYLTVLPNYRHGGSNMGLGLSELSPKSLGPVDHKQPDHPPAESIENLHQFSKVWWFELDDNDNLTEIAWKIRKEGYLDKTPHRHKCDAAFLKKYGGVNIPKFSLYVRQDGTEARFTYVESRFIYCYWMEKLAKKQPQWEQLVKLRTDGYNINICGYDGYPTEKALSEHYEDPSRPFGHEKVLESMLIIDDPQEYPWNVYRRKHPDLYLGLCLD